MAVGLVGFLGHDGRLGHRDPREHVLERGIDADVLAFAESHFRLFWLSATSGRRG